MPGISMIRDRNNYFNRMVYSSIIKERTKMNAEYKVRETPTYSLVLVSKVENRAKPTIRVVTITQRG